MGRVVYFVLGPESSGTKLITASLVSAGVYGQAGHRQHMDYLPWDALPDSVVFRRSLPHAKKWIDPHDYKRRLAKAGYEVKTISIDRDTHCMIQSQIRHWHVRRLSEAEANIARARAMILELPRLPLLYEDAVRPGFLEHILGDRLGLDVSNLPIRYNGNERYK